MGKSKKKRFRQPKQQPTGLPSVKETTNTNNADDNVETKNVNNQASSLLEKLHSVSVDERECTCTTIANVVADRTSLDTLLVQNVVKELAPLLLDNSPSVREASAGALRNMSVHGQEVCEKMILDDVMTPVVSFLHKHGTDLTPKGTKNPKEKKDVHNPHLNTVVQIVSFAAELV